MSVTAHLRGGIGNQMAIYAAGLALSRKLGVDLKLDISAYESPYEPRMYSLGLFKGVDQELVQGLSGKIIQEKGLPYDAALFENAPKECSIVGYFQSERYFAHLRDELAEIFMPKKPLREFHLAVEATIKSQGCRSCFVTVRRTDYVDNDYHGLLDIPYYNRAANAIISKLTSAAPAAKLKPYFFVFSDDPHWCVNNFRIFEHQIFGGNFDRTVKPHLGREDAELWLMRQCENAICANSSYSWWGAWLGADARGGTVVAPERWFGKACKEDPRDIVPDRWVKA